MAVVTIAGGSGLIGMALSQLLVDNGHHVNILTRSPEKSDHSNINYSVWDVNKQKVDENIIRKTDVLINLAGANLADSRWTDKQKKIIIESRVKSNEFLSDCVNNLSNNISKFMTASAVGYYGDQSGKKLTEESPPGNGFLSEVCVQWEKAVDVNKIDVSVYKMRTGVVLAKEGGAFPKLRMGLPLAVPYFGIGDQIMSWIHIEDICEIYKYFIESEIDQGIYNVVAPHPASSKELSKSISKKGAGPGIVVRVPAFALKLAMGEMSTTVLDSIDVSAEKLLGTGFKFKYTRLDAAVEELFE